MEKNYFGITDIGKIRDNNEDTFIAESTTEGNYIIAGVIDGVGGYSGGEIASDIAKQSILKGLSEPGDDLGSQMKAALIVADLQIMAEKQKAKEYENMACVLTLAMVDLNRNRFHYVHVGDTRLYLLRDKSLVKISKDQSFVGFMEDSGRLTEEQAMQHPKRNEINKALGFGAKIAEQADYIDSGESPFLPGDTLLICSDGLSDMVTRQEITDILLGENSLEEKGMQLIAAANKNGGRDNITVVLVKNDNQSLIHEATKPTVKPVREKKPVVIPVSEKETAAVPIVQETQPIKKGRNGLTIFLAALCFLLLSFSIYLLYKVGKQANTIPQEKLAGIKIPQNAQEIKLQDTLSKLKGNTLILTDSLFKSPILLTEPLLFNKDTLYIKAKSNMIIKSDSAFKGNAIVVKPASKYILLENITFEGFNTAISSQNNALLLLNVQFNNCLNAIETTYHFPDKRFVNGKISRTNFKTDSLAIRLND